MSNTPRPGAVRAAPGVWTETRVDILRKLWGDGLSASQVATCLGEVTRNSVIGKVHRLGLAARATTSRNYRPKRKPRIARSVVRTQQPRPFFPPKPLAQRDLEAPQPLLIKFLDLRARQCRWPVGDPREADFAFCGRHSDGTYCPAHDRIAFQPASRRKR